MVGVAARAEAHRRAVEAMEQQLAMLSSASAHRAARSASAHRAARSTSDTQKLVPGEIIFLKQLLIAQKIEKFHNHDFSIPHSMLIFFFVNKLRGVWRVF